MGMAQRDTLRRCKGGSGVIQLKPESSSHRTVTVTLTSDNNRCVPARLELAELDTSHRAAEIGKCFICWLCQRRADALLLLLSSCLPSAYVGVCFGSPTDVRLCSPKPPCVSRSSRNCCESPPCATRSCTPKSPLPVCLCRPRVYLGRGPLRRCNGTSSPLESVFAAACWGVTQTLMAYYLRPVEDCQFIAWHHK